MFNISINKVSRAEHAFVNYLSEQNRAASSLHHTSVFLSTYLLTCKPHVIGLKQETSLVVSLFHPVFFTSMLIQFKSHPLNMVSKWLLCVLMSSEVLQKYLNPNRQFLALLTETCLLSASSPLEPIYPSMCFCAHLSFSVCLFTSASLCCSVSFKWVKGKRSSTFRGIKVIRKLRSESDAETNLLWMNVQVLVLCKTF